MLVQCAPWLSNASLNSVATTSAVAAADEQPRSGVGPGKFRQLPLLPFDGQQPLAEQPIVEAVSGDAGAESQPLHAEQHGPVLVEHIDVGFDAGGVDAGDPQVAVAGIASRAVGAESTDTQPATPARSR